MSREEPLTAPSRHKNLDVGDIVRAFDAWRGVGFHGARSGSRGRCRAVSPYTTDFQIMVTPGETLTTFTYTVPINDPQAGVAFDITGNSPPTIVCIDDVVLSPR
jgi:hypothetical protein